MPFELQRPYAAVLITAAFLSLGFIIHAAWIPAKAQTAQWLLRHTWLQIQAGNRQARPWPWADTRPAAVLQVPRYEIEQFVLEGSSGRNLAFGPVLMNGFSDQPGTGSDRIINGHRDTHFRFLEDLSVGDVIRLQTAQSSQEYQVATTEIVDSREVELVLEPGVVRLSLVTCYPFDAVLAGGPLRYVVTALPLEPKAISPRLAVSSG